MEEIDYTKYGWVPQQNEPIKNNQSNQNTQNNSLQDDDEIPF